MNCKEVQRALSSLADNRLTRPEQEWVQRHLSWCVECRNRWQQLDRVRRMLRGLPAWPPPPRLVYSLRVLASRERARGLAGGGFRGWATLAGRRVRLWADNFLRPAAVPVTGGILSAVLLFAILAPVFSRPTAASHNDVPIWLSREATFLCMGPYGLVNADEIVLDLTVDPQGRIVDYSAPAGENWIRDPRTRRSLENALLFTQFTPGTTFGQPAAARVRITLRRSEIDVRG
ncbi:MAG: zf-HC2 domain-containing protein [Bryobacterales bacterium]|nr:zf-HC2 domain-containing protein [Bryobacteraceae bacterium]MDW8354264.1 zf-HC2 domain-containing protein [Bryobacterales bacterium]